MGPGDLSGTKGGELAKSGGPARRLWFPSTVSGDEDFDVWDLDDQSGRIDGGVRSGFTGDAARLDEFFR